MIDLYASLLKGTSDSDEHENDWDPYGEELNDIGEEL